MNVLKANVINELEKLFLKKKATVLLTIITIISFLSAFFVTSIKEKLVFMAISSMNFPLMILSFLTNIFLPLSIFMITAELFSGEMADKTMKLVLTSPISRFKVYLSKLIALGTYIAINLIVVCIVTILASSFLNINLSSISHIIFSYSIDLIPALILAIFAAFIAQFFRSSSTALISCIIIFTGVKALSLFVTVLNNNTFASYLNWSSLWASSSSNFLRPLNILILLLSYGIIFFTMGYYIFDKKEI